MALDDDDLRQRPVVLSTTGAATGATMAASARRGPWWLVKRWPWALDVALLASVVVAGAVVLRLILVPTLPQGSTAPLWNPDRPPLPVSAEPRSTETSDDHGGHGRDDVDDDRDADGRGPGGHGSDDAEEEQRGEDDGSHDDGSDAGTGSAGTDDPDDDSGRGGHGGADDNSGSGSSGDDSGSGGSDDGGDSGSGGSGDNSGSGGSGDGD